MAVACSVVFLLGMLQLFGVMDDVNVLLGAMLVSGLLALMWALMFCLPKQATTPAD